MSKTIKETSGPSNYNPSMCMISKSAESKPQMCFIHSHKQFKKRYRSNKIDEHGEFWNRERIDITDLSVDSNLRIIGHLPGTDALHYQ
jgi:hypothetical protein